MTVLPVKADIMEEKRNKYLLELRISLSSFNGRVDYILTSKKFKITKETAKTLIIKRVHGEYRVLKTELDDISNMCKNDKAQELSFSKYCYEQDFQKESDKLVKILKNEAARLHKDSIAAYKFSRLKDNLKIIQK